MKTITVRLFRMPESNAGRWSLWLVVAMPVFFLLGSLFMNTLYASVPSGDSILMDIALRPSLSLFMLSGMAAGVLAFFSGLLAIIREKERSIFVFASTLVGSLMLLFLVGEIVFPH